MNKRFLLLFSLCCLSVPCFAQDPPDVPAGNPTQFPLGNAEWTIDVIGAPMSAPSANETPKPTSAVNESLQKIVVTKSGTMQRTVTTTGKGMKVERWFESALGVMVATDTPDGSPVCLSAKNQLRMIHLQTGFEPEAFQWLDKEHFVNLVMYKGIKCLHYKKAITLTPYQRAYVGGVEGTYEAWVDQEKHLPIALSNGITMGIFTFAKDPPGPLTMPKPIADELRSYTTPPHIPGV